MVLVTGQKDQHATIANKNNNCLRPQHADPDMQCRDDQPQGYRAYYVARCPLAGALATRSGCTLLDTSPETCPIIGSRHDSKWTNIHDSSFQDVDSLLVDCTYNLDEVATLGGIIAWRENFPDHGVGTLNETILPVFCAVKSSNCVKNTWAGTVEEEGCSMFMDSGEGGEICRNWQTTHPELASGAMYTYSRRHRTADTLCINASSVEAWQIARNLGIRNIPTSCWWNPCVRPTEYLVPIEEPPNCPTEACITFNNIVDNDLTKLILAGGFSQIVNCVSDRSDVTNLVQNSIENFFTFFNTETRDTLDDSTKFWIWMALLLFVFGLIFLIIHAFTSKKRVKHGKKK